MAARGDQIERLAALIGRHGHGALVLTPSGAVEARLTANGDNAMNVLVGVYTTVDPERIRDDILCAKAELRRERNYVQRAR